MDDKEMSKDELRPEYDEAYLKAGVRGKYADRYSVAINVARLDPDVATSFPNDKAVNEALRRVLTGMDNTGDLSGTADSSVPIVGISPTAK